MKYFNEQGIPTTEAAPFFAETEPGSGIYEPTIEHDDRWNAVAEHLPNFDGSLIIESLVKGWTVAETVAQGREDDAEHREHMRALEGDYELRVGRDMSMNY